MSYPNQEQAAVLGHPDGTLLVLAPAGTGKTRLMDVITTRTPTEHTLGVTFTNRATAEYMRAAVQVGSPPASGTPTPQMISVESASSAGLSDD